MAEPMMLQALPGTVERDGWDWLLYVLSVSATFTAIVAFLVWVLELRRRPEVRFHWGLSPDGDPAHLAVWEPDDVPEIKAAQPFLVRAAIQNTGDKAGHDTLINFVASDRFDLHQVETPEGKPAPSGNATAGLPPDTRVVFFAPQAAPWAPPNWQMRHYRLRYVADPLVQPLQVRLLFTVSDSRFNRSGRRWLPSLVPPSESQGAPVGTPWPPKRASRRTIRWALAEPRGRVACMPGERSDVRDLIVVPVIKERPQLPRVLDLDLS